MVAIMVANLGCAGPASVQRVLRDWSAVGLVREMLWVDASQLRGRVMATHIKGATSERVDFSRWRSGHPGEKGTVCILDMWGWQGEPGFADADAVSNWVKTWRPGDSLRVIAAPADFASVPDDAIPAAQQAILLSGLGATAPDTPLYPYESSDPEFITNTATGLCGVARLWSWFEGDTWDYAAGVDQSALRRARVARSFVRVIDSRPLLNGILDGMNRTGEGLPIAIGNSGARRIELPRVAPERLSESVSIMARAVLGKNATMAKFNRPALRGGTSATAMGVLDALKHYVHYVGQAIRNLPADVVLKIRTNVENKVVKAANSFYGDNSQLKVALTSARADQENRLAAALAAQSQQILGQQDPNWSPEPPQAELLWTDVLQVACGLVDGGAPGDAELARAMPRQGDSPMVITQPAAVAPDPNGPPFVGDSAGWALSLSPSDPVAAHLARKGLAEAYDLEQDPAVKAGLADLGSRLDRWIARQRSFVWDVGWSVADSLIEAIAYQTKLQQGMGQNERETWLERWEKSGRALRRGFIITLVLILVGLGVVACLAGLGILVVGLAVGIGIGWLVVMFFAGLMAGMKQINNRFRAENELKADPLSQADKPKQDLSFVAHEVVRLSGLADQVRPWVWMLGELVHHTKVFGAAPGGLGHGTVLTGSLPFSMQVAQVQYEPEAVGDVGRVHRTLAYSARAELFSAGWFSAVADARITEAGAPWRDDHAPGDDDIVKLVLADSRQDGDGIIRAVMKALPQEVNRTQSGLHEKMAAWVRGGGQEQWQQALRGAHLTAGEGSAFDAATFFSDLRGNNLGVFREDFSDIGQGNSAHGGVTDFYPPVYVGLSQFGPSLVADTMDGLLQGVCRVVSTAPVADLAELRCFVSSGDALDDQPVQVRVAPRFGSRGDGNA